MRESIVCPICRADRSIPWATENGWTAVQCASCATVYVNPRPVRSEILQSAQTGMHEAENSYIDTTGSFKFSKVRGFRRRLQEIITPQELDRKSARWLDIGCGYGELLSAAAKLLPQGAHVEGIEPSLRKREFALSKGLKVTDAALETFPSASLDFVSLMNVFSHLPEPVEFLGQIAHVLRPGGLLIVLTGNGGEVARHEYPGPLDLPDHLIFVGETGLRSALEQSGFSVLSIHRLPSFIPENPALRLLKNIARFALRRPLVHANKGRFRNLVVKAAVNK